MLDPILIDIPTTLTTNRLILRQPQPGEGKHISAIVSESLSEIAPWMAWTQDQKTADDYEINIRRSIASWILRESLRLHIIKRETGEIIGSSGLHAIDWSSRRFEIGYWIATKHSGHGFITESTSAIAEFAFRELKATRIEIRTDADNLKSNAVPKRLGFELETIHKNHCKKVDSDALRDTHVYVRFDTQGLPNVGLHW